MNIDPNSKMDVQSDGLLKISQPETEDTANIITYTHIKHNGVRYDASYEYDGLKIPVVVNKSVYYQLIPRDILKAMLLDLVPEILSENNK